MRLLLTRMLSKQRKKLLLIIVSFIVIGLGAHQFFRISDIQKLNLDFTSSGFATVDSNTREKIHYSRYKFSYSDAFGRKVGGWDTFASKSQAEKCVTFFKFVDSRLPDWEVSFFKNRHFDKSIVNKAHRIKNELKHIKDHKDDIDKIEEATKDEKKNANEVYLRTLKETISLEQEMADTMTIVRLFGHCFFSDHKPPLEGELMDIYNRYASKVIPFIHPELPSSGNGDIETNSRWPFDGIGQIEGGNLLDFYYKNMKGTGVVLSTATRHSRDVVRLIHVLRALGNTLPIEVVYRSDLSTRGKQAILLAGSSTKEELLGDEMTDQNFLRQALESAEMNVSELDEMNFPKQDITLINLRSPLSRVEKNDFSGYDTKLLALFFNSFEKAFLFDTDAVPLLPLEKLQSLKEFTDTGAFFFRDRTLLDRNDWIETNYFAKLMPHDSSKIDMAMGVKPVTSHTLGNTYMNGWRHCQEAGLVILDRRRHFRSLLTLLPLSIWKEPIQSSIWGDKEMYWLAMSIAGDEEYTLNHYGAASVGEITAGSLKHYNNSKAAELCSSHPGHVSKDGQLLWINSGFSYCKKNGYARDKSKFPFSVFQNVDEVKSLYHNPLKIRHAISPPELPSVRAVNGPPDLKKEVKFIFDSKERKKDVDEISDRNQIDAYDPQKGWIKSRACSDYQYCAYNAIESFDGSGQLDDSGVLFEFDAESNRRYDILGAIWGSSSRTSELKKPSKENTERTNQQSGQAVDSRAMEASSSSSKGVLDSSAGITSTDSSLSEDSSPKSSIQQDDSRIDQSDELKGSAPSKQKPSWNEGDLNINDAQSNSKSKIEYDPSKVIERPEKLNNDVKQLLSQLTSTKR